MNFAKNVSFMYTMTNVFESVGLLIGAYLFLKFSNKLQVKKEINRVSYLCLGALSILFFMISYMYSNFYSIIVLYSCIGFITATFNIVNNLHFQTSSNEDEIGKVYAFKGMVTVLGFVLGTTVGGGLSTSIKINTIFNAISLILFILLILIVFFERRGSNGVS